MLVVFIVDSVNFISNNLNPLDSCMYGGVSLMVERKTVALIVRVQFPGTTLSITLGFYQTFQQNLFKYRN